MKKLFLIIISVAFIQGLSAQVQFEKDLSSALSKAQSGSQMVMVINSATFCGPCHRMQAKIYPLPEVSEYLNKNFVCLKYELDKADPDNIKGKYGIAAFPTFIFLDSNGRELGRFLGGCETGDEFIAKVKSTIDPANSLSGRLARLGTDPSYGINDHVKFLDNIFFYKELKKFLPEVFSKQTAEEKFNPERVELYTKIITSVNDTLFKLILDEKDDAQRIMGNQAFNDFVRMRLSLMIMNKGKFLSDHDQISAILEFADHYKIMDIPYVTFLRNEKKKFESKNYAGLIKSLPRYYKIMTDGQRNFILRWLTPHATTEKEKDILNNFI